MKEFKCKYNYKCIEQIKKDNLKYVYWLIASQYALIVIIGILS